MITAGGKDLPVGADNIVAGDLVGDDDAPLIAWLPAGLNPVPFADTHLPGGSATAGATPPSAETLLVPGKSGPTGPSPLSEISLADATAAGDPAPVIEAEPELTPEIELPAVPVDRRESPALRPAAAPSLVQPAPTPASIAPAAQTFAAAIAASLGDAQPAQPRPADPATIQIQAQAATEQLRTTVQAMSAADQAPLDLTRDDWTGRMIDRIAALRDAAEATDTRIRLAPEHLGNIDVSLRRDGDRIHIHFNAENPATRQLLADAAPRLAELAEARGVKLGQSSVESGAGNQPGTPQRDEPHANRTARPASAAAHDIALATDGRVA